MGLLTQYSRGSYKLVPSLGFPVQKARTGLPPPVAVGIWGKPSGISWLHVVSLCAADEVNERHGKGGHDRMNRVCPRA